MELSEVRRRLEALEGELEARLVVPFADFDTPHGALRVSVTSRFKQKCQKGRIWKSPSQLTALKNAAYGFDPKCSRSRGGADGIFIIDRSFHPPNSMMKKLFAQFLDKPDALVPVLVQALGSPPEGWFPVRLVSHHLRLLGVIAAPEGGAHLVLVDYDDDKDG